jgi:hypothetical protein
MIVISLGYTECGLGGMRRTECARPACGREPVIPQIYLPQADLSASGGLIRRGLA